MSSMGGARLLCVLSAVVLCVGAVVDFHDNQTLAEWSFMYHDYYHLIVSIHNDSCYFTYISDLYADRVMDPSSRQRTEELLHQIITHSPQRAVSTTMALMRTLFNDLLADLQCADRHVFRLDLKGDDFVRAGIISTYDTTRSVLLRVLSQSHSPHTTPPTPHTIRT